MARVLDLCKRQVLPVIDLPRIDVCGGNGVKRVHVAEFEGGAELTVVFWDEDRPERLFDLLYDLFRVLLLGRWEDIETFHILYDDKCIPATFEFHGTYSGDTTFYESLPSHLSRTLPFNELSSLPLTKMTERQSFASTMMQECTNSSFQVSNLSMPVVFVNTWNHLFGEKNSNSTMPMVHYLPAIGSQYTVDCSEPVPVNAGVTRTRAYQVCYGSRADVNASFRGLVGTFHSTMDKHLQSQLGKRIW